MSAVRNALESAMGAYPLERKVLVCTSMGAAKELLRAAARGGTGWIGCEPATPKALAYRLVAGELARDGITLTDELDERAALDEAMDEVLAGADARFRVVADGPGFRSALANSIEALRLAGVSPAALRDVELDDVGRGALLADALAAYEARLVERRLTDAASSLRLACERLQAGTTRPPGRVLLVPGLPRHGLAGRFITALLHAGAEVLPADTVHGLEPPPGRLWLDAGETGPLGWVHDVERAPAAVLDPHALELFHAASPADELREVLRRVVQRGLKWDEVEIVASDAAGYGTALDGFVRRLGIPVTYAVGLPIERTRAGRALTGYLRWIEDGFPADVLRGLLEAGDLGVADIASDRLARRLRRMRIGWGHERYGPALAREAKDEDAQRALRDLLTPILERTPPESERELSPARLARGALAFLERVPVRGAGMESERLAHTRLTERIERIATTLERTCSRAAALAELRTWSQIRVPAPDADGRAPWGSAGGRLHLTDVEHAGFSGRRATFFVGLDDASLAAAAQDPLLPDAERVAVAKALGVDGLPTSAHVIDERRHRLAAALARLRGHVTLSHAAWDATDGRTLAPSPVLLQALRLKASDHTVGYAGLAEALGVVASAVPRRGALLDGADAWLGALASDAGLRRAEDAVAAGFPRLANGIRARTEMDGARATARHGFVGARPGADPRDNAERYMSPSALESLGTCGLRYFFRYMLRIRAPDDPVREPDVWLDNLARGRLLHTVFETTLRAARDAEIAFDEPAFDALADRALADAAEAMREEVPAPSDAVYARELRLLHADVSSFCTLVRERGAPWHALELAFGPDATPVECVLPSGATLRLNGRIDRVDTREVGYVVVDYKTGGFWGHGRGDPFGGGRRLQHVVYAEAAARLLNGRVDAVEYHYPTRRGMNEVFRYDSAELRDGLALIERLLDLARDGQFFPTDNPDDCKFCDYRGVCRAGDEYNPAPVVRWAREYGRSAPEYAPVVALREKDRP